MTTHNLNLNGIRDDQAGLNVNATPSMQ